MSESMWVVGQWYRAERPTLDDAPDVAYKNPPKESIENKPKYKFFREGKDWFYIWQDN